MSRAVRRRWMLNRLEQRYGANATKHLKFVEANKESVRRRREIKEVKETKLGKPMDNFKTLFNS